MTPPKNNSVKIIILIAVLCALFFLGNVFQYLSKNNVVKKYTSQISDISIQKASIEQDFNSSQEKITELSDNNRILDSKLSFYKDTIKLLKSRISNILNRDRITPAEKAAAKNLIDKLNSTIAELNSEIENLKNENQELTNQNQELTNEMNNLVSQNQRIADSLVLISKELDEFKKTGAALHVSKIVIKAFAVGKKGKTTPTNKAKEASSLSIDFNLDANPLAESGNREIYINILSPDGTTLTTNDIATFTNGNGEEISYSEKMDIDYQNNQSYPANINVSIPKGKKGTYTIQVFYNGEMIGENTIELK